MCGVQPWEYNMMQGFPSHFFIAGFYLLHDKNNTFSVQCMSTLTGSITDSNHNGIMEYCSD